LTPRLNPRDAIACAGAAAARVRASAEMVDAESFIVLCMLCLLLCFSVILQLLGGEEDGGQLSTVVVTAVASTTANT
jgi:hypothetical protein